MAKKIGCLPVMVIGLIIAIIIGICSAKHELKIFWIFFLLAMFLFLAPEMENSMDRVYCGREVAKNNVKRSDIMGFVMLALELCFDIIVNLDKIQ
jgi:galactitol-specific phosphotransferase system IIC component